MASRGGTDQRLDLTATLGASSRRIIETTDIRMAVQWRARGQGWQSIGQRLGVNAEDIRKHCEPPEKDHSTAPAERPDYRPTWLRTLIAIAEGADTPAELVLRIDVAEQTVHSLLRRLRRDGMLDGTARAGRGEGWCITPAGRSALNKIEARS